MESEMTISTNCSIERAPQTLQCAYIFEAPYKNHQISFIQKTNNNLKNVKSNNGFSVNPTTKSDPNKYDDDNVSVCFNHYDSHDGGYNPEASTSIVFCFKVGLSYDMCPLKTMFVFFGVLSSHHQSLATTEPVSAALALRTGASTLLMLCNAHDQVGELEVNSRLSQSLVWG